MFIASRIPEPDLKARRVKTLTAMTSRLSSTTSTGEECIEDINVACASDVGPAMVR